MTREQLKNKWSWIVARPGSFFSSARTYLRRRPGVGLTVYLIDRSQLLGRSLFVELPFDIALTRLH
jgi:hypothetical protein